MQQIYLIIALVFIMGIVLVPIKVGNYGKDKVFGKENMTYLKGVACIMVVVTHTCAQLGGKGVLILPSNIGFLAVGIFFFWSGYGLMHSYLNKENYLKGFITKRILLVYIPFVFSNIIFLIYSSITMGKYSFVEWFEYIIGVKLICGHAWFIQTIILLYIVFYLIAKISKGNNKLFVLLLSMCILGYKFYQYFASEPLNMVKGNIIPFLLGYFVASINWRKIGNLIRNHYKLGTVIVAFLFVLTFLYISIIRWHLSFVNADNKLLNEISGTICQCSFLILVLLISSRVTFNNRLTKFLGEISYEIYLLHQIGIDVAKFLFMKWNLALTLLGAVLFSVIIGYVFWMLSHRIISMKKANIFIFKG